MERTIVHMILHFLVPFMVAKTAWKENWLFPFIIMVLTIAVDFDHLLAVPIFDPTAAALVLTLFIVGLPLQFIL